MNTPNPHFVLLQPDTYLWLMAAGCLVLTLVCWLIVRYLRRRRRSHHQTPNIIYLLPLLAWFVLLYGTFVGFTRLEVRQVEFSSPDLPASFDGYRILHVSDLHVGTYTGWRQSILERVVDSINAQHADLIVFTGDLQNTVPSDIYPHKELLSTLKAADGVCSVLGNHDYAGYADCDEFQKYANCGETRSIEMEMGWTLLTNGYHAVRRGGERIFIAGMENDGEGRFPQLGDISSALYRINRQMFVVMLEHDPSSWRRKILPHSHCQLTLSGHTHGGQFSLFGLTPAHLLYPYSHGMYYAGQRAMNVSAGVGGVVPFRFGVSPEITVITLRCKK